jgi:hypothetical protein
MKFGFLAPTKNIGLVLLSTLVMAMPMTAFAQSGKLSGTETVIVPGVRIPPGVCGLQLLNSVPLQINNDQLTVPADVNGKTRSFLLDTAAVADQMTDASARALGLDPQTPVTGGPKVTGPIAALPIKTMGSYGWGRISGAPNSDDVEIYDSRGMSHNAMVTVADFTMQTMEDTNIGFHITPLPPPNVDGLLSLELFQRFDLDLNFPAQLFNMFSKDHCRGQILYWRAPGMAALPFLTPDNRIHVHVLLEGKDLTAIIDTGSPVSVLRFDVAKGLFGVTPDSAGVNLVGQHHDDSRQDLYAYNFKTLSFGTVAIGNPHLLLTPDTILVHGSNPHANTGTRVVNDSDTNQPDMIIGMDVLKYTHLYIALGEGMLYVTQGPELAADAPGAQPVVPVMPFRP